MTKDVISLSISVLLLFRHYISHKITFGAPSSGGVLCSACGAFIAISDCHTCTFHAPLILFWTSTVVHNQEGAVPEVAKWSWKLLSGHCLFEAASKVNFG